MKDANGPANDAPKGGKQYSTPQLTEYGSVAKLTMVKGGSFVEFGTNKRTTSCL
jgi:hypothetical protein